MLLTCLDEGLRVRPCFFVLPVSFFASLKFLGGINCVIGCCLRCGPYDVTVWHKVSIVRALRALQGLSGVQLVPWWALSRPVQWPKKFCRQTSIYSYNSNICSPSTGETAKYYLGTARILKKQSKCQTIDRVTIGI